MKNIQALKEKLKIYADINSEYIDDGNDKYLNAINEIIDMYCDIDTLINFIDWLDEETD